jgi:hypothetical protein
MMVLDNEIFLPISGKSGRHWKGPQFKDHMIFCDNKTSFIQNIKPLPGILFH